MIWPMVSFRVKPTGVGQASAGQEVEEVVGAASGVGADQDRFAGAGTGVGDLGEGLGGDLDVVGGGVGAGVAWPQDRGGGLAGAAGSVVDECHQ